MSGFFNSRRKAREKSETDALIESLKAENAKLSELIEKQQEELNELRRRCAEYADKELAIEQALMCASVAGDEIVEKAKKRAEEEFDKRMSEIETDVARAQKKADELSAMKERIRYILQTQLAVLDNEE